MIKVASGWKDYEIIATGDGKKLERWGKFYLLRPDPQVIWKSSFNLEKYDKLNAVYVRSSKGGGEWVYKGKRIEDFIIERDGLKFSLKLMGFKHTGLFPEQAVNWDAFGKIIKDSKRKINVLNLFAYTGGATLACLKAGAAVCHVDAAKAMTDRAKQNVILSGFQDKPVRFIVDDCVKFVEREIKRGKVYDAVIMDPPSYGRGPKGEIWKIEDNLYDLCKLTSQLLSDNPLFFLINSYTTGLQSAALENILKLTVKCKGIYESYEVALPTCENIVLPCGTSGIWRV